MGLAWKRSPVSPRRAAALGTRGGHLAVLYRAVKGIDSRLVVRDGGVTDVEMRSRVLFLGLPESLPCCLRSTINIGRYLLQV